MKRKPTERPTTRLPACDQRADADRLRGSPRVLMAGKLTALDAPGGGEVQMAATARALESLGVQVRFWRPWEDDFHEADCLHLFGSLPEHVAVAEAARRRGLPVVLSTIAWFDPVSYLAESRPLWRRVAGCASLWLRARCPALPSWRRRLYESADLLLPNSNAEAKQIIDYFQVPAERIHVVPNGADERFADGDPEPFVRLVGMEGFVLVAGRIEPRKNQLRLLTALQGTGVPVVVLGDAVPGHEAYAEACRRAAGAQVAFVGRLAHHDPMLSSAYAACGCLALASWYETPGLVALEAGMSGAPLVLPARGAAAEYFGDDAFYVKPNDAPGIRAAVMAALGRGRNAALAERVRRHFSWTAAARVTQDAYRRVL
jgi:glycosyltransferase involved in cell wall biosynthesis